MNIRTFLESDKKWDKRVLLLAFVIGSVFIWVLKHKDANPLWVILWPAFFISLYLVSAYFLGRVRIEVEAVGDNCYYLGFLFTLVSLAVTLYLIIQKEQEADVVISGFGVALYSTIVGILFRVLLSQPQTDVDTRDREVRNEISNTMRRFRDQLRENMDVQRHFATETSQRLTEQRKMLDETMQVHKETLAMGIRDVQNFYTEVGKILSEQQQSFRLVSEANKEAHQQALTMANLMRQETEAMSKSVQGLTSVATESTKTSTALSDLVKHIDNIGKDISNIKPAVTEFQKMMTKATQALTDSTQGLNSATSHLENTKSGVGGELEQAADTFKNSIIQAAERLDQSNATLLETAKELRRIARKTRPKGFWTRLFGRRQKPLTK